jgi:hypothetical protein
MFSEMFVTTYKTKEVWTQNIRIHEESNFIDSYRLLCTMKCV